MRPPGSAPRRRLLAHQPLTEEQQPADQRDDRMRASDGDDHRDLAGPVAATEEDKPVGVGPQLSGLCDTPLPEGV